MPISFLLMAVTPMFVAHIDFPAFDQALDKCDRETILPVFAAEGQRQSAFLTGAYEEQARINAERFETATKRRLIREGTSATSSGRLAPLPLDSDEALALRQLALDDRQRALDDQRRLETLRQQAVDVKRKYFLTHCSSRKAK